MKGKRVKARKKKYPYGGTPYDEASGYFDAVSRYDSYESNNMMGDQIGDMATSAISKLNPAIGGALQVGSMAGQLIEGADKYGVAKSNTSAFVASAIDPMSNIKTSTAYLKEGKLGKAALSAIPGIGGLMNRKRSRKERGKIQDAERLEQERQANQLEYIEDKGFLNTFDSQGIEGNTEYFQHGGQSNLRPVGGGNSVINGESHENGGVPIGGIEAEGGEVLTDDGKIISNRVTADGVNSLAEEAIMISQTPAYKKLRGKLDKMIEPLKEGLAKEDKRKLRDRFTINTKHRNVEKLEGKIKAVNSLDPVYALFEQQEALKEEGMVASGEATINDEQAMYGRALVNKNVYSTEGRALVNKNNNLAYGGYMNKRRKKAFFGQGASAVLGGEAIPGVTEGIGQVAPYLSYFVDNLANTKDNMPQVPEPIMDKYIPMKTKYDITAPLNEMKRNLSTTNRAIRNTASSSASARGAMAEGLAKTFDESNSLYTQKENQETNLINADRANAQGVANANVAKRNNYNMLRMRREAKRRSERSENYANLSGDFQDIIQQTNQYGLDKDKIAILSKGYENSGATGKLMDTDWFMKAMKTDPAFLESMFSSIKNNPTMLKQLQELLNKR
jgi:hypothetical protein